MPNAFALHTKTKTKTGTKVAVTVGVLLLLGGLGYFVVSPTIPGMPMQCDSGPNAGRSCTADSQCKLPSAPRARCLVPPDLVIRAVHFDPSTHLPEILVMNKNGTGGMPATWVDPDSLTVAVDWLSIDGRVISIATSTDASPRPDGSTGLRALAGGSIASVIFPASAYSVPSGAVRARIRIDVSTPGVAEFNEVNNTWEGAIPLPDLAVRSVSFDPVGRFPTLVIINQGNSAVVWTDPFPPQVSAQWLRADGTLFEAPTFSGPISAIVAGASSTLTFDLAIPPSGAARLRFTLDSGSNRVVESDETNNTWEGPIPAPPPAPVSPVLSLSPTSPSGGSVPGMNEVLIFTVSAVGTDVSFPTLGFHIDSTDTRGTGWNTWQSSTEPSLGWNGSAADMALYAGTDLASARVSSPLSGRWFLRHGTLNPSTDADTDIVVDTANFIFLSTLGIPAGTSKTFILRIDSTGASRRDRMQVQIPVDINGPMAGLPLTGGTLSF